MQGARWATLTLAAALGISAIFQGGSRREQVDRIVIEKSAHSMSLMSRGAVIKSYKVAISRQPIGPKEREGDHKTPEGVYEIDRKNPNSRFHLALHVSYPNASDRAQAQKLGVKPGGDIEIHGLESKFSWLAGLQRQVDLTDGCIAVTNAEIEEVYSLVPVGTPVEIRP